MTLGESARPTVLRALPVFIELQSDCPLQRSNQRNSLLKVFLHGITFRHPVGVEAGGQSKNFEILESHAVRGAKGGTDVWALIDWTTAAIEDDFSITRQVDESFAQIGQALRLRARPCQNRAGNVSGPVEDRKPDAEN